MMGYEIENKTTMFTILFANDQIAFEQSKDVNYMTRKIIEKYWNIEYLRFKMNVTKTKYIGIVVKVKDL